MMTNIHHASVERFWEGIAQWEEAYIESGLSFVAVHHEDHLLMIQGRLFLRPSPLFSLSKSFESKNFAAGYFLLSQLELTPRVLVDKLLADEPIDSPIGPLFLPKGAETDHSAYLLPFHPEGISGGSRLAVLQITGEQRHSYIRQPQCDWELKAASEPFDSLAELLAEYSLGPYQGDFAQFEVIANTIAEVDLNAQVQGTIAKPAMFLATTLDTSHCHLGYRVLLHGQVTARGTINGKDMAWEPGEFFSKGVGSLTIPSGAVLQCFTAFRGMAQHQGWIADPNISQNAKRAAFEEFDEKLTVLRDFLLEEQKPRRESRDFEIGIAWLMWMLGFSVAHSGATSRTSDATDILATTPMGHMALVECTTGHIKAETKLSKLVARAQTIRRRLDSSGNRHIRLLAVIVTALGKEEIKADLDQAQQLGVVVVTKEDLVNALARTIMLQDANQIFAKAEDFLRNQQEQLNLKIQQN